MSRKAVQSITVSLGSVSGLALAGAPAWGGGSSVESDKIAAFGDDGFTTVPRPVKSYPEITFTFIDEGDGKADSCDALSGTVVSCTVAASYGDGKTTATTQTKTFDVAVLEVHPGGETTVDGERKATFTVKCVRHAPAAAAAPSNSGTNT